LAPPLFIKELDMIRKSDWERAAAYDPEKELSLFFDMVEELVGIDPSTEDLKNAIHAVCHRDSNEKESNLKWSATAYGPPWMISRVEDLTRQYETVRKIHQYS